MKNKSCNLDKTCPIESREDFKHYISLPLCHHMAKKLRGLHVVYAFPKAIDGEANVHGDLSSGMSGRVAGLTDVSWRCTVKGSSNV